MEGGGLCYHTDPHLGITSPIFLVVFSRGDVLVLWALPVAWVGGSLGGSGF